MNETPDSPNGDQDTSKAEEEIANLASLVSEARERVAGGNTVDVASLSDKIGAFCASIAENPPADAEDLAALIQTLVAELNSLGEEIAKQHKMLSQQADKAGDGS